MPEQRALPKSVQEALEGLDRKRERVMEHVPSAIIAHELAAELENQGYGGVTVGIGVSPGAVTGVLVHLYLKNLDRITVPQAWLRKRGFRLHEQDDYAEIKRRTVRTRHPNKEYCDIVLLCFFGRIGEDASGDACRFVQVGVKEEPVYELRCGEEK